MLDANRLLGVVILCATFLVYSACSQAQTSGTQPAARTSPVIASVAGVTPSGFSRRPSESVASHARFTLSTNDTTQYDSSSGWSNVITPDLSFHFNRHFSVDANVPWYLTLAAYVPTTVGGVTTNTLRQIDNVIGDATSSGRFEASGENLAYKSAVTVGFPTGNSTYGIGAKSTSYNFSNHLEYSVGPFTPDAEIGIGNSSALTNQTFKKAYTAVGGLVNFQGGTNIDLPKRLSLDVEAYEMMPVSAQSVFGTINRAGKNGKAGGKQVLQGTGTAEDNGLTTELSLSLTPNLTLSGQYDRSFRQEYHITGVSITWTLPAPRKQEGLE